MKEKNNNSQVQDRWQRQTPGTNARSTTPSDRTSPYVPPSLPPVIPEPNPITLGSNYPFTINLRDTLSGIGSEEGLTVLDVQEVSDSVESTEWDAENSQNSFAVPNTDGTLTYSPKGSYMRNALIVKVQVDAAPGDPPVNTGRDPVEVVIPFGKNVIGNTEAHKTLWHTQGANGTCAAMAVGTVLASYVPNVTSQWQVLADSTLVIGPDGTHLNTPTLVGDSGGPAYVLQLQTQAEVRSYRNLGIRWVGKVDYTGSPGNLHSDATQAELRRDYPTSTTIQPNIGQHQGINSYFTETDNRWTESFFEHYGVQGRLETAVDFASIIAELRVGNPVILRVDGAELRGSVAGQRDRFNTIMDENNEMAAHIHSDGGHVVWLTAIDNSDPDNPVFTVIDSSSARGVRQYNMRAITAAAEDAEFEYITIGQRPDVLAARDSFEAIAKDFEPTYMDWWKGAYGAAQRHANGNPGADRPDELPPPAITNEQAQAITGKTSVAEAWATIYKISPFDLGDWPAIVATFPNEPPYNTLSSMVTKLNALKTKIYRDFGFDATAYENLKANVDIE